ELRHWEWHYLSRCLQVEPRVLRGHGAEVWAVTYSRDGQRLASAGLDNLVHIWDPDSGELLLTLKGHTGPVWSVTFSTDGTRIATGSDDATVRLWDATTGKELQSFEMQAEVLGVAFNPDGKQLAAAAAPGHMRRNGPILPGHVAIWDIAASKEIGPRLQ